MIMQTTKTPMVKLIKIEHASGKRTLITTHQTMESAIHGYAPQGQWPIDRLGSFRRSRVNL